MNNLILSPTNIIFIIIAYFAMILFVSYITSRKANSSDFYKGGGKSPWWAVAFGMIGTTLSGVTFISVPGAVANLGNGMSYFIMVLGNFFGFLTIAYVLLPLYYRLNVTSIYSYIEDRIGYRAYKTSAVFFLVSKIIGAGGRLYLVVLVLQFMVFEPLQVPFWINAFISIALIWSYTVKGGIKTIIWTDVIQTSFLIFAVVFTIFMIKDELGFSTTELISSIFDSPNSKMIFTEWGSANNFLKLFVSGFAIPIAIVGLDQDMMQKSLSLPNIKAAQKNFISFSYTFIPVNLIFLSLGVLLAIYMSNKGITLETIGSYDKIYPYLATTHLGIGTAVFFILGVIAAAFSSANSAMIGMTTSFTIDIYGVKNRPEKKIKKVRFITHTCNALVLFAVLILFYIFNDESIVYTLFKLVGFTYGPLLGLYIIGIYTKVKIDDRTVPFIAPLSVILSLMLYFNSESWFGYKFGFEILLVNALFTIIGLLLFRKRK